MSTVPVVHGYYVPADGTGHGDPELAIEAAHLWARYFGELARERIGRHDGVSVWQRPDGTRGARIVGPDFFTGSRVIRELDVDTSNVL